MRKYDGWFTSHYVRAETAYEITEYVELWSDAKCARGDRLQQVLRKLHDIGNTTVPRVSWVADASALARLTLLVGRRFMCVNTASRRPEYTAQKSVRHRALGIHHWLATRREANACIP
jgi:hypothetical protein